MWVMWVMWVMRAVIRYLPFCLLQLALVDANVAGIRR